MNNSHICFFIGSLSNKGGTERMTTSLANELIKEGYIVSIISLTPIEGLFFKVDARVTLHSILSSKGKVTLKWPLITYKLLKITQKEKVDILIDVDVIQSLFSLPVKMFNRKLKIVSWEHFNYQTNLGIKRRDYARKLAKKYADAIVTLTKEDKAFYEESGAINALVYSITNFLENTPSETAPLDNKIMLAVGRFTYQKAFDLLVNIWNLVKNDPISKAWVLHIVGDGEDKESIKNQVISLGLESSVQIIDATEKIDEYYLNSSGYLMTSRFEGLPMVLIEAKSYGLPIVSYDCKTGPASIIVEGEDGYLIPMGNELQMMEKILKLMSDTELRKNFGEKAKTYSKFYTKSFAIQNWKNLIEKLTNGK